METLIEQCERHGIRMKKILAFWKQNSILAGLILVELIIIITTLSGYGNEKLFMDIPYQDIIGTTIPDDRGGWYVDETFPLEESGLFDHTEDIPLKKGSYDITVYYETDTDHNSCTTSATTKGYHNLITDVTPLSHKVNEVTYTVFLKEDVQDFRIETYFGGSGYMIIKGFHITQTRAYLRVMLFMELLMSAIINAIYILYRKRWFSRLSNQQCYIGMGLLAIIVLSSYPILGGYCMFSHDIGFHLLRMEGLKEGLLSGQFPVKMQPIWMYGYGYPTSVYYGDLFFYLPAMLRVVGFTVQTAYMVLVIVINAGTAFIAYWSFEKIFKHRYLALAGALLYTIAPYRLTDLYVRNAFGEAMAMAFLPLVAYGITAVFTQDTQTKAYQRLWIPMVIGFSGIIQSHLLTCIMCGEFVLLVCVLQMKKIFQKNRFLVLCKTVIYTGILNLWFIYPCITSMKNIDVTQPYRLDIRIQKEGTFILELFNLIYRGTGDATLPEQGVAGKMPNGVGLALGIGLFLFAIAYIRTRKEKTKEIKIGTYTFALSIVALFMTTIYFPWDYLSAVLGTAGMAIANIQFGTRYLAIANVMTVMTTCAGLLYFKKHMKREYFMIGLAACVLTGIFTGTYIMNDREGSSPATYVYDIDKLGRTDHNVKEYLRYGTDIEALVPNRVCASEGVTFENYTKQYVTITLDGMNTSGEEGYIEVPLLYYDEYVAKDTQGVRLKTVPGDNNVLRVILPAGYEGSIRISYKEPISWRICEVLSLLFLCALIGIVLYQDRGKDGKQIEVGQWKEVWKNERI